MIYHRNKVIDEQGEVLECKNKEIADLKGRIPKRWMENKVVTWQSDQEELLEKLNDENKNLKRWLKNVEANGAKNLKEANVKIRILKRKLSELGDATTEDEEDHQGDLID